MRLHRFITTVNLSLPEIHIDDVDLLKQWTKVLRLKEKDRVILCDGKGKEAEATITEIGRSSVALQLDTPRAVTAEPDKDVTLYCAVLKRENFEWVVQKCTELGVKKIVPVITARTVKTGLKMERLRMIAKEAAEQSGRGVIPEISEPVEFAKALRNVRSHSNFFFHTAETSQPSQPPQPSQTSTGIWIGPEGGWTDEEGTMAQDHGCTIRSLGELTLRAETAAVIASFCGVQGVLS